MAVPRKDYETMTNLCCNDEGELTLTYFTTNPAHARRMMKRGVTPDRVGRTGDEDVSWTFRLSPDRHVAPRPKKRVSDETRAKSAARLAQARFADGDAGDDDESEGGGDDE